MVVAWRLSAAAYYVDFPSAVSDGLFAAALLYFPLDFVRRSSRVPTALPPPISNGRRRPRGRWPGRALVDGVGVPVTFVTECCTRPTPNRRATPGADADGGRRSRSAPSITACSGLTRSSCGNCSPTGTMTGSIACKGACRIVGVGAPGSSVCSGRDRVTTTRPASSCGGCTSPGWRCLGGYYTRALLAAVDSRPSAADGHAAIEGAAGHRAAFDRQLRHVGGGGRAFGAGAESRPGRTQRTDADVGERRRPQLALRRLLVDLGRRLPVDGHSQSMGAVADHDRGPSRANHDGQRRHRRRDRHAHLDRHAEHSRTVGDDHLAAAAHRQCRPLCLSARWPAMPSW